MRSCFYVILMICLLLADLEASGLQQDQTTAAVNSWRIINYWSEFCAPCRKEIPILNELKEELTSAGSGGAIVGVNFDEGPRAETLAAARRMGIEFPTLSMHEVDELQLKAPNVLPTTYILSPDNEVLAILPGEQNRRGLLAKLGELNLLAQPETSVTEMETPVGAHSNLSRVVSGKEGGVYLSWVTMVDETSVLSWSRLEGDTWYAPKVIARGDDWFINWADFPSLVVNEDTMAAHWLRKSAEGPYDYDIKASFFQTNSQAWSKAITVHKDDVSAEHGFVSMLPLSEGRTFISWLDGRNTRPGDNEEGTAGHDGHSTRGAMTVRAGIFDREGKTLEEWQLDGRACDCCQTSAALAASGPVVVYRDRSEDEIRDIFITRFIDGHWSSPKAVFHDGWKIAGCPVNGPSVVARGRHVAVAWFSAKNDSPEVKLALSHDNGATFSKPVVVSAENTIGRISAAFLASGQIAVSWVEAHGESASVMLAHYSARGELLERVLVAQTLASRRSGFPVISSLDNDVYVTWTDISAGSQVRLARVRFQAGPAGDSDS